MSLVDEGVDVFGIGQKKWKKVADCIEACPITAIELKVDGIFSVGCDCADCDACESVCNTKPIHRVRHFSGHNMMARAMSLSSEYYSMPTVGRNLGIQNRSASNRGAVVTC